MGRVLGPLKEAGMAGIFMASGNGLVYRNHPLVACFSGDYPEQVLTTCVATGECAMCPAARDEMGDYDRHQNHGLRDLDRILEALDSFDDDPGQFLQTCAEAHVKPVVNPFWKDLPYVHIYRSITPDILHQLYQGILKHMIGWVIQAVGRLEVDARCRRLPPNHNIRLFVKGITSLSRVTGQEHNQMSRILLGLVIDAPLPNGLSNVRLIRAVRALLDFLYLAQYPVHTDETLALLEDALEHFHNNKEIFVDLGIRDAFNIPKLHFASHYVDYIKLYGTLDNFNTKYTERLHIDLAKNAYAATNHKDEFTQMAVWLEQKEKIHRHRQYVDWRLDGSPPPPQVEWTPPGLDFNRTLKLTKYPIKQMVPFDILVAKYGATHFRTAVAHFIALTNEPNITRAQLERRLRGVHIPFNKLPVWHRIKFTQTDPSTSMVLTADSIHCYPGQRDSRGKLIPGRFDTALINDGTGEELGLDGTFNLGLKPDYLLKTLVGYRIGRIRVVFSIPECFLHSMFIDGAEIPEHLAYVDWYSPLPDSPERNHLLYKVSPQKEPDGTNVCSIIPLANIRCSIHLFPKFGPFAPQEWTSSNVLDLCNTFFVNDFTDRHMYRIAC